MIGGELAERICSELGGKMVGSRGRCRCPAHDDRSPSLCVTAGEKSLLIHCFAGCSQGAVIEALQARGLWIERGRRRRRARRTAVVHSRQRDLSYPEALNRAYGYQPDGSLSDENLAEIERLRNELRVAGGNC